MEELTIIKGIGKELKAWCSGCRVWIDDVEIVENCHPYNRDYIMCSDCHEGIVRSE